MRICYSYFLRTLDLEPLGLILKCPLRQSKIALENYNCVDCLSINSVGFFWCHEDFMEMSRTYRQSGHLPVMTRIAIENGPLINYLPIKNCSFGFVRKQEKREFDEKSDGIFRCAHVQTNPQLIQEFQFRMVNVFLSQS